MGKVGKTVLGKPLMLVFKIKAMLIAGPHCTWYGPQARMSVAFILKSRQGLRRPEFSISDVPHHTILCRAGTSEMAPQARAAISDILHGADDFVPGRYV